MGGEDPWGPSGEEGPRHASEAGGEGPWGPSGEEGRHHVSGAAGEERQWEEVPRAGCQSGLDRKLAKFVFWR